jgi:PTH1 family peptidyl-tRNA hydrolase
MAWLQKRPQIGDSIQFYSTGLNKSKFIVGLGNPGNEYDQTRHNIGFACLDAFVAQNDEMASWIVKKDLKCLISTGRVGNVQVFAIKPTTFMNLSGEAVQAVASFYKLNPDNTVVVHDELDVNFGQIRLRNGGSSAGHNGLKSLIQHYGENFGRVRIGIGPKIPEQIDSADFVLQKFSKTEQSQLVNLFKETNAILSEYLYGEQLPTDTRTFLI